MTVNEWLEKHHPLKPGEYYLSWKKLMKEYGKYCAMESWKEAIQQYATLSLSNMVNGEFKMKSPEEWWLEFQRKEETE